MIVAVNDEKLLKRFWEKVNEKGPDDCWEWTAGKNTRGYGQFKILPSKPALAHRVSYELHKGEIPKGLHVLHSCNNASCVNPNHLRVGTAKENYEDQLKDLRQSGKI